MTQQYRQEQVHVFDEDKWKNFIEKQDEFIEYRKELPPLPPPNSQDGTNKDPDPDKDGNNNDPNKPPPPPPRPSVKNYKPLMDAHRKAMENIKGYITARKMNAYLPEGSTLMMLHDNNLSELHKSNTNLYLSLIEDPQKPGLVEGHIECEKHLDLFKSQTMPQKPPFLFWLLCDQDPLGYGDILTPPCNHRQADQSVFAEKHRHYNEPPDTLLLKDSRARQWQFFQNGSLEVMPYEIIPVDKDHEEISFQSVATGKFQHVDKEMKTVFKPSLNIRVRKKRSYIRTLEDRAIVVIFKIL